MEDTGQGYHYPVENLAVMSTDGSEGPFFMIRKRWGVDVRLVTKSTTADYTESRK